MTTCSSAFNPIISAALRTVKVNCAVLLMMCCSGQMLVAQSSKKDMITLRANAEKQKVTGFRIAQVMDEREDPSTIGYLIAPRSKPGDLLVTQPVDLEGGADEAIQTFFRQSVLSSGNHKRQINIRIQECLVSEIPSGSNQIEGRVVLTLAFDLVRNGEPVHLIDYRRGGAHYSRPANSRSYVAIDHALRKALLGALRYFDSWLKDAAGSHVLLAEDIEVSFTDFTENNHEDTVFYATDRPLKWSDFRERPRMAQYAASIFPNFGYESQSEVVEGVLQVNMVVKVFMLPSYSWVRDQARNAYGLNHEQRHFDIAKIAAEKFKQMIQADTLTAEDFNSAVQWIYLDAYREMNRLQEQYDDETGHGTNTNAQARWNQYIDNELQSFGVVE